MVEQFLLGPLEKHIMNIAWQSQAVSVKAVHQQLAVERPLAYTTVMTIMGRLVEKGLLERTRQGRFFVYKPKTSKQQAVSNVIQRTMEVLVQQFGQEAVVAFIDEADRLVVERPVVADAEAAESSQKAGDEV